MEHKLDLLENAVDSLNEALRKFQAGEGGDARAYKFAIMHFAQSLELLFKYHVTQSHPLLIYKNPFSKNISKEFTIGLWEAIQFLKNEGKEIPKELSNDLEWIKDLRNNIEHYKFEMDVHKVRRVLGRLIRATIAFNEQYKLLSLSTMIEQDCLITFNTLSDKYKSNLAAARAEALDLSENGETSDCRWCGEKGTRARINEEFKCCFCADVDPITRCCQCNGEFPASELTVWNDDHRPHVDYICELCFDHIMSK